MKKDFIHIQDFEASELEALIRLTGVVKEAAKKRALPNLLHKASVAMIFEEASTRTRTSFEVASMMLGGHALYMRPDEIHLGKSESLYDTAKVLSRMVDGIVIRATRYGEIADLASYADVPVINAMADDANHPTQALCDVFTMYEKAGRIKGLNLAFVGVSKKGESASNVCRDLMLISSIVGINCTVPLQENTRQMRNSFARPERTPRRAALQSGSRRILSMRSLMRTSCILTNSPGTIRPRKRRKRE